MAHGPTLGWAPGVGFTVKGPTVTWGFAGGAWPSWVVGGKSEPDDGDDDDEDNMRMRMRMMRMMMRRRRRCCVEEKVLCCVV